MLVVQGAPVSAEVMDAAPLRLVCCARGGPVNVDVAAATARGIPVVTTPGKNADAVAELTLAFALMLVRGVPESTRYCSTAAQFGHDNYEGARFSAATAAGMTLGLIGFGQVGRRVAARAQPFGLRVLAHDPFVDPATSRPASSLVAFDDAAGPRRTSSRCTPGPTPDNRDMLGAAAVRRDAAGRVPHQHGPRRWSTRLRCADALAAAHLAGAALDVDRPPPAGTASAPRPPERRDHAAHRRRHLRDAAPRRRDGGGGDRAAGRRAAPGNVANRNAARPRQPRGEPGARCAYLLAIDLGTGSCRAVLFDEAGQQVAIGQREWAHRGLPGVPRLARSSTPSATGADLRLHPRGADLADATRRRTSRR